MKITSIEIIKSGSGQKGPWNLAKITVEGSELTYTGFFYREIPKVGDEVDLEFYQEEYQGKMQDKFKLKGKPKAEGVTELMLKQILMQNNEQVLRKLNLIIDHLKIEDTMENIRRRNEIEPEDVPF